MGKEINRIKKMAAGAGIDTDVVIAEIADEIATRLPPAIVDEAALMEKVAIAVEARVGAKLSDVLESLKRSTDGSKPDTESIVRGVANLLQPQLIEAAREASEAVFAANSQSLLNQMQERLQKASAVPAEPTPIGVGALMQILLDKTDSIVKLISAFRPPQPEVKAAELLGMSLRLADKIDRIKSGQGQISDLTKDIQESLTKGK